MTSFGVRGVSCGIAVAIAALSLADPSAADAQRRTRRAPSGETAESASGDPQLDAEARGLFVAGREAFDAGRYDNALDYFTRAYALSGRSGLLFNIASTAERLRRDEEALRAYEAYLEAMPDAPNRDYTHSRIMFLRDQIRDSQARPASVVTPSPPAIEAAPAERRTPAPAAATARTPQLEVLDDIGLGDGQRERDDVLALQAPVAPGAAGLGTEQRRGGDVTQEWWFWTLVGVAVVGAGAGITAGVVASQSGGSPSAPVQGDFGPGGVIVALEGN